MVESMQKFYPLVGTATRPRGSESHAPWPDERLDWHQVAPWMGKTSSAEDRVCVYHDGQWSVISPQPLLNWFLTTGAANWLLELDDESQPRSVEAVPPVLEPGRRAERFRDRLHKIDAALSALTASRGQEEEGPTSFATSELGDQERGIAEEVAVKPIVDLGSIALVVQKFPLAETPAWVALQKEYPAAMIFAIDPHPRSFEVKENGVFDGRASVLLSIPRMLRSGRASQDSITLPARVSGLLSPAGGIEVTEFRIAKEESVAAA
jgi:hypothetical protein